jgi:hypothetical protein
MHSGERRAEAPAESGVKLRLRLVSQRTQSGFRCPLRIPELARARPSLRCAPFKYFWCMGGIRCVAIYSFFGAEEMDFGPQRSPTSKYDFELEKRVLYAL